MAKKDFEIKENIDRGESADKEVTPKENQEGSTKTEVKNANAAGQGAIGRTDDDGNTLDRD
ncbi:MAG: hypothetical protein ACJ749_10655 [Flavisolibacter sp.]